MNLQALVDAMNDTASQERAKYQMTLGGLVTALEGYDPDAWVLYDMIEGRSPSSPQSYRGYYCDLSLPPRADPIRVSDLLELCREAVGRTFEGYKGGDFTMHSKTPLWASPYGDANGVAIMDAKVIDGRIFLITKQID